MNSVSPRAMGPECVNILTCIQRHMDKDTKAHRHLKAYGPACTGKGV